MQQLEGWTAIFFPELLHCESKYHHSFPTFVGVLDTFLILTTNKNVLYLLWTECLYPPQINKLKL